MKKRLPTCIATTCGMCVTAMHRGAWQLFLCLWLRADLSHVSSSCSLYFLPWLLCERKEKPLTWNSLWGMKTGTSCIKKVHPVPGYTAVGSLRKPGWANNDLLVCIFRSKREKNHCGWWSSERGRWGHEQCWLLAISSWGRLFPTLITQL